MRKLMTVAIMGLVLASCTKKTQCTSEEKSMWHDQESFKSKLVNHCIDISGMLLLPSSLCEL